MCHGLSCKQRAVLCGLSVMHDLYKPSQSTIRCVVEQVAQHVKLVDGLWLNQRVAVRPEHVVDIRFHDQKISP